MFESLLCSTSIPPSPLHACKISLYFNYIFSLSPFSSTERAHVLKKHKDLSESQKSSGTFWDRYEDEDHEENLEIIAQHSELENKTGNQSVLQIAEASSNAPSHRRIVSDPPPLESWHLGDIE